jgi:hypothetical protein
LLYLFGDCGEHSCSIGGLVRSPVELHCAQPVPFGLELRSLFRKQTLDLFLLLGKKNTKEKKGKGEKGVNGVLNGVLVCLNDDVW